MAALRAPDTGCPWDIEQDFKTIAPYTLEEAYEVIDAIVRDDHEDLREELGDLLLQVIYHSRMAEEQESFNFDDVVEGITSKMIRRHPHVFGDEKARTAGMAKGAWERIKQQEKREKSERRAALGIAESTNPSLLDEVPIAFPALVQAEKLQQKASKVGFDWNNPKLVLNKIREEIDEFEQALGESNKNHQEAELGDILFAFANLARHLKFDPENALRRTNRKFRIRFAYIEDALVSQGRTIEDANLEEMEALWQEAKLGELG